MISHYQSILKDCQNDITSTWQIMKEITGKGKVNSSRFPISIHFNGNSIKNNKVILQKNSINTLPI